MKWNRYYFSIINKKLQDKKVVLKLNEVAVLEIEIHGPICRAKATKVRPNSHIWVKSNIFLKVVVERFFVLYFLHWKKNDAKQKITKYLMNKVNFPNVFLWPQNV